MRAKAGRSGNLMAPSLRLSALVILALVFVPGGSVRAAGPAAGIALVDAAADLVQTGETLWTLAKTGMLVGDTVTWQITAAEQATIAGQLQLAGTFTVVNKGAGPATIGHILVNLQTRTGSTWITRSTNVADATYGDAATTATVVSNMTPGVPLSENAASGTLEFMDASANTVWSLVPQQVIAPGATVTLLFAATFDNTVLQLAPQTAVRAEIIVSFGNAAASQASTANVDINGNGAIDADEARVRSVPARIGLKVPAQQDGSGPVTLTDTLEDLATTGTVTFADPIFSLGPTTGTVSVTVNGGASGGTITNCAHLTSAGQTMVVDGVTFPVVGGVNLTACDTVVVGGGGACTPGAPGCGWSAGDLETYNQNAWGNPASVAGGLLVANHNSVYAATFGALEVGIPGTAGFSIVLGAASAVLAYLPALGPIGPLTVDVVDPTSTAAGAFGGEVVALKLNIDFSDTGVTGSSAIRFGDVTVCGLPTSALNGLTVREVLARANVLLGGGTSIVSITQLDPVLVQLNASFGGGVVTTFAQDHLVNGACPPPCTAGAPGCGWSAGDLETYDQTSWGSAGSVAGALLVANYNTVYASTFGALTVGILGGTGFSMTFTAASSVIAYLPALGSLGPLTNSLLDPTSSASGAFGGQVVALKLNVDFSDAGVTQSSVPFGDVRICGLATTALNGRTVRDILAIANVLLGGGSSVVTIAELQPVLAELNVSYFAGTTVSSFAQAHLVTGGCP